MGGIAEDEHPLAGEVGGVHRARVPGKPGGRNGRCCWQARSDPAVACCSASGSSAAVKSQQRGDLLQEGLGGADADRHGAHHRQPEAALQPGADRIGHLRIKADVGIGLGEPHQIGGAGAQGRHHGHIDAVLLQQARDFFDIVATAETQQGGTQQIHPWSPAFLLPALG